MNELILIYCVFMYMFALGFVYVNCKKGNNTDADDKFALFVSFVLAPLIMPLVFGIIFTENNL